MDTISAQSMATSTKRTRVRKLKKEIVAVSQIDSTEARLSTHEQVCSERYKALETRMDSVEKRMDAISADVKELKQSNEKQFGEIKSMLTQAKDEKFKTMVTVAGTVIVALIGLMGYIVTHLK
jgi:chromosome segregation ATPase